MSSMYDTIMELPLFKGIGEEQLSSMLEKTSIEFLKFEEGEVITEPDNIVKSVDFILNGDVRQKFSLKNLKLDIVQTLSRGDVLGARNLFGLERRYCCKSIAINKVNIMRIDKSQYMNILQTDNIYMLNFVNYLSAASQKIQGYLLDIPMKNIATTLGILKNSFATGNTDRVKIEGRPEDVAAFCGVSLSEYEQWLRASNKE